MIQLKVVKKDTGRIKNHFIVTADEPVTIEVAEAENGHTVALVYRGTTPDEYSEPVGAYDSAIEPQDWVVE